MVLLSVLQQLDGVRRDGIRTEDGGFLRLLDKQGNSDGIKQ
jgi:hypothetical protein